MSTQHIFETGPACNPQNDNVFGPIVIGCRGNFDFTLLFEQIILSLIPSITCLLLVPLRLSFLYRKDVKTLPNYMRAIKFFVSISFAALNLVLLVLWSLEEASRTKASVPTAALNFFVALQIVALSYVEHSRSIKPSSLINVYLLFTLIFDIAQARTLYLQGLSTIWGVFVATMGVKLALLLVEAQEKRSFLKTPYTTLAPEATSGILNRSLLWWINGLFIHGYRNIISYANLYELDQDLLAENLGEKLQKAWGERSKPEGRFAFVWANFKALRWPFLSTVFPRVCVIGFHFAQPFLFGRILDLLQEDDTEMTRKEGYGLIGATGLVYFGIAICKLHYEHRWYRFITMFRGASIALIYNRTLYLAVGTYDEASAVTLMSTDVDSITQCLRSLTDCWAGFIEVVIGTFLLARQVGWICIVPLLVIAISSIGSSEIAKHIGNRQRDWADAVQRRIAITSSILSEMRAVKMMGLGKTLATNVQAQRVEETNYLARFRVMIVWQNTVCNIPFVLAPAITFIIYAIQAKFQGSDTLDTTKAFTSLALITLVSDPASRVLAGVPGTAASLGCFDRIQEFLLAPLWSDRRLATEEVDLVRSDAEVHQSDQEIAISVEHADIKPAQNAEIALHGINIEITQGCIAMVIGPVGSGKSTLLKAIIGEIPCESGQVSVASRYMAYCAQDSWLANGTVQQRIVENRPVEVDWYQAVTHACDLEQDIASLPAGDQTIIGSRGVMLSGGQKQRLALARAVYSRCDIVILDDVLSALDAKTKNVVVERVFSRTGLLQKLRSTVVLVTHSTQYLHLADKIILVSENGYISKQGSYEEVKQDNLLTGTAEVLSEGQDLLPEKQILPAELLPSTEDVEDLLRRTGDVEVYKYYFKSVGWIPALTFVFFAAMTDFGVSFSQIWLKWWTDTDGGHLGLFSGVYLLLAVTYSGGNGGYVWAMVVNIAPASARKLHQTLLNAVMSAPQSFFTATDTGTIMNRFSQDMSLIEGPLATAALITTTNLFGCIAHIVLISLGSVYMGITIPLFAISIYTLQHVYLATSRQLRYLDIETRSPVYAHFAESLEGISTIRAFGWQKEAAKINIERLDASQRPYYLLYCVQIWLRLVLDLIVAAIAIILVALAMTLRKSTNPGLLGVSLNNVLEFNMNLSSLVIGWTQLETSLGAIARLRVFESETPNEAKESENVEPPAAWPSRGAIEFRSVTASHNASAVAVHDVSFVVSPGQKVGICGRTGSGKSSLVSTLLRILEIERGAIFVDGLDLATLPRETIRERLITIPQDPLILITSVRLNADPSGDLSDERVVDALAKVRLWDTIKERGGLSAELNMQSLSKGQQQLFALARAMLRKSTILILDEATSNVDPETDRIMQSVIREEFKNHTIITVAHRINTIMDSDKILVMDGGRSVEFGSPAELLSRDSAFRRLQRS